MYVPIVEDDKGQKYSISPRDRIGEGATAEVWLGVPLGSTASTATDKVAIKIPHPGASRADIEKLKEEHQIVQAIGAALKAKSVSEAMLPIPWTREGKSGTRVPWLLVMELAPTELQEKVKSNWSPTATIEAVRQYLQLLVALHSAGYATYGDRKETDLRWDEARSRLIVLDWNRAGKLPDDIEARNALIAQDTHGFAQLFSAILFGETNRYALPEVDNLTSSRWQAIPRGVRVALIDARNMRANAVGNSVEALLEALTRYSTAYALDVERATDALLLEARELSKPSLSMAQSTEKRAERQLDLLDAVAARPDVTPELQHEIEELRSAAERLLKSPVVIGAQEVQRAIEYITTTGDYQRSLTILNDALASAEFAPGTVLLRLIRWQKRASIGATGALGGLDHSHQRDEMDRVFDILDQPFEEDDSTTLKTLLTWYETRFPHLYSQSPRENLEPETAALECIGQEIGIRGCAAETPPRIPEGRARSLRLTHLDPRYAINLGACLPKFELESGKTTLVDDAMARLETVKIDWTAVCQTLIRSMGDLGQCDSAILTGIALRCRSLANYAEVKDEAKPIENACMWLSELCMQEHLPEEKRSLAAMLTWAKNPPEDLPTGAFLLTQAVLDNLQVRLVDSIRTRLSGSLWPDEITELGNDVNALIVDGATLNEPGAYVQLSREAKAMAEDLDRQLKNRKEHLAEVERMLLAASPGSLRPHPLGGLEIPIGLDTLSDACTAALDQADKNSIEIFNVHGPGRGNWSVREVLQRQRMVVASKLATDLTTNYRSATAEVSRLDIIGLRAKQEALNTEIDLIALAHSENAKLIVEQNSLLRQIKDFRDAIDAEKGELDTTTNGELKKKKVIASAYLCRVWLMEGFHAVQLLEIDEAESALVRANALKQDGGVGELAAEFESLEREIAWLNDASHPTVELIKTWREKTASEEFAAASEARQKVYAELRSKEQNGSSLAVIAIDQDYKALEATEGRKLAEIASSVRLSNGQRLATTLGSFLPTPGPQQGQKGLEAQLNELLEKGQIEMYLHLSRWHSELLWAVSALERAGKHLDRQERKETSALRTDFGDAFRILSDLVDRMDPSTFHYCHQGWLKLVERLRSFYEQGQTDTGNITRLIGRGQLKSELGKNTTDKLIAAASAIR